MIREMIRVMQTNKQTTDIRQQTADSLDNRQTTDNEQQEAHSNGQK
jgi:hypothetical protein